MGKVHANDIQTGWKSSAEAGPVGVRQGVTPLRSWLILAAEFVLGPKVSVSIQRSSQISQAELANSPIVPMMEVRR